MVTSILDCTLRDGGYYTAWDFSDKLVSQYLSCMASLPVDTVELGYRSPGAQGYAGRYYHLPREVLVFARGRLRNDQKLAIMLNAKQCAPELIPSLLRSAHGIADVVRMAVAPAELSAAIELARAIRGEGFEVAINLMYLSRYHQDTAPVVRPLAELLDIVQYVSLVDSYGACMPRDVAKAIANTRSILPQKVGFHGHDNLQLAFANALAAIEAGADMVDSTVMGMGRGAGNLATELIAVHEGAMERSEAMERMANLLDAFSKLKAAHGWGASLPYMISGMADLPQKDVMDWLGKRRYSPASIVLALQNRDTGAVDDTVYPALDMTEAGFNNARHSIVVGGGRSVAEHAASLRRLADELNAVVIHSSTRNLEAFKGIKAQQVLCLAGHEPLHTLDGVGSSGSSIVACLVAAPPRFQGGALEVLNVPIYQTDPVLLEQEESNLGPISDVGPLGLALGAAKALKFDQVLLTGFDGYKNATAAEQDLAHEVQQLLTNFAGTAPNVAVSSLTPTRYAVNVTSLYKLLAELDQ